VYIFTNLYNHVFINQLSLSWNKLEKVWKILGDPPLLVGEHVIFYEKELTSNLISIKFRIVSTATISHRMKRRPHYVTVFRSVIGTVDG
jgi:hypothetical protein